MEIVVKETRVEIFVVPKKPRLVGENHAEY